MGRLAVALAMLRGQGASSELEGHLDRFYRPQAEFYDRTRETLLRGRRELVERLDVPKGGTIVDLGGGTGRSLAFFGPRLGAFEAVHLVDLSRPLLEQAERRILRERWENVHAVHADSTTWRPPAPVDCVHVSYSLTMVPEWFRVVDNAVSMLKPGGLLGVVDFYVSRRRPRNGSAHGFLTRHFWRAWFEHDGVHLSQDHLPYLRHRLDAVHVLEERNRVLGGIPYYVFVGKNACRMRARPGNGDPRIR